MLAPNGFLRGEKTFLTAGSLSFPLEDFFRTPVADILVVGKGALPFRDADTTRLAGEGLFTEAIVTEGLRVVGSDVLEEAFAYNEDKFHEESRVEEQTWTLIVAKRAPVSLTTMVFGGLSSARRSRMRSFPFSVPR